MIRIGTAYFVSRTKAATYYRDAITADRKLSAGEIHIGKPPLKNGERLVVIDFGTRYAIEWDDTREAGVKLK